MSRKPERQPELEKAFSECLKSFPLYDSSRNAVFAIKLDDGATCLNYEASEVANHRTLCRIDIQIIGTICYILTIGVRKDLRRKGYGRKLVECVEQYAKQQGCKELQTTPSGTAQMFWLDLGFLPTASDKISHSRKIS